MTGCCQATPKEIFLKTFPIIGWLSKYNKEYAIGDIVSGCTVAVMHIPQGMGYALLAEVPPIVGIYMVRMDGFQGSIRFYRFPLQAFFPVLLYAILGTSKHNSMGTFAVISIMVGKTVLQYSGPKTETETGEIEQYPTPLQIVTILCFMVGVIQVR